jgi:hypothetical protein
MTAWAGGTATTASTAATDTTTLDGDAGNDVLIGGAGNDLLIDGSGNDAMFGADGADLLVSRDGNGEMHGELGNDLLIVSAGHDLLWKTGAAIRSASIRASYPAASRTSSMAPWAPTRSRSPGAWGLPISMSWIASSWVRHQGADTVIDFFRSGTHIVLENVTRTNLVSDDFAFL